MVKPGLYQHYKGPLYEVLDVARHSETEEQLIVYRALYGEYGLWVRPVSMFQEVVEIDGKQLPRFKYLEPQTGVLEVLILEPKPESITEFEQAYAEASKTIQGLANYIDHDFRVDAQDSNRFMLTLQWTSLEEHRQWKTMLEPWCVSFLEVGRFRLGSDL